MALSPYELRRLEQIRLNQAQLVALGLAGDNSLQEKPCKPRQPRKDDAPSNVPTRRSSRLSNGPKTYQELSNEFCHAEERRLARSQRSKSRPKTYDEEQAREIEDKKRRARIRRENVARQQQVARQQEVAQRRVENGTHTTRQITQFSNANIGLAPLTVGAYSASNLLSWHTDGEKGMCPRCFNFFVIRKDGCIRDHDCRPAQAMLPPTLTI